jgi:hypothetical protein
MLPLEPVEGLALVPAELEIAAANLGVPPTEVAAPLALWEAVPSASAETPADGVVPKQMGGFVAKDRMYLDLRTLPLVEL